MVSYKTGIISYYFTSLSLLTLLSCLRFPLTFYILFCYTYRCPKNGVLTVHCGVEEITVNIRKMLKKFYWTHLLIWRSLKVALNRSIILQYMYEIVMAATSHRTYYHKVQDHSLPISNLA
jgi:hypothetical protein